MSQARGFYCNMNALSKTERERHGQLKFEAIEVVESRVRLYSGTAVSTDARKCGGRFGETLCSADSRYKHVCVE